MGRSYADRFVVAKAGDELEEDRLAALINCATAEVYEYIDHCTSYAEAEEVLEKLYGLFHVNSSRPKHHPSPICLKFSQLKEELFSSINLKFQVLKRSGSTKICPINVGI